jgi:Zn-finger protein
MSNSIPQCIKCNSPVTDSVEVQIEQHEKIKLGHYIDNVWICDDCINNHKKQQDSILPTKEKTTNNEHHDIIEVANSSNVSPNTSKADEADIL